MFSFWSIVGIAMCGSLVLQLQADPVKRGPINWGPIQVLGEIGEKAHKYWPLNRRDIHASNNARFYAEEFRRFMKTGWGIIPPLDPYDNKHLPPLDIDDEEVQGTINLSNFLLVGAKEYYIANVELRLENWRLDFVLEIPLLQSNVDFQANIKVDEVHNLFQGHVNVSLNDVVINGSLTFKSWPKRNDSNHQKLSIVAGEYNITSSNVQYNARDLDTNTRRSHSSSQVIKTIAQKIAEEQALESALEIITLLNKGLHRYTTAQVLAWLLSDDDLKLPE